MFAKIRLYSIRLQDWNIQHKEDLDTTLEYVPEFSPLRQQNIPPNMNDENVFGENTPTPPRYRTPPRGAILNSEEAKMFVLLKHYGLGQYVPIFLEQEVNILLNYVCYIYVNSLRVQMRINKGTFSVLRTARLLLFHGQSGFPCFTESHFQRHAFPKRTDRDQHRR